MKRGTRIDGLTAGIQIRLDTPFNGCKYFWFSSTNENIGTSCGSPVGFIGNRWDKTVYVTEGYLKAIISYCLSGLTFAAVAGANNYHNLIGLFETLRQNGVEEIVEAYDMDKLTNIHVEKGCRRLVELAVEYSFTVRRIKWDPASTHREVHGDPSPHKTVISKHIIFISKRKKTVRVQISKLDKYTHFIQLDSYCSIENKNDTKMNFVPLYPNYVRYWHPRRESNA
ncbi:MAG: toprim domain-containing protein [Oscillospiraceae bacterium]|nr:toprim domain-containing protein [Oscillospiraceae bacterium]